MKVVCDSSGCCGIKHIRDFPETPHAKIYPEEAPGHDDDENDTEPPPYYNWARECGDSADCGILASAYLERLVNHIKERRPAGMITVNLVAEEWCDDGYGAGGEPAENWRGLLTSLGFRESQFRNSNSDNIVSHFTLIYDEE